MIVNIYPKRRHGEQYSLAVIKVAAERLKADIDLNKRNLKVRKREYVLFRQTCMAMLAEYTHLSLSQIAAIFNKNHATCIHAIKTIDNLAETDRQFRGLLNIIRYHIEKAYDEIDAGKKYNEKLENNLENAKNYLAGRHSYIAKCPNVLDQLANIVVDYAKEVAI